MAAQPGQRVAVIGVGIMGSAIARRLLECGHAVCVFDAPGPTFREERRPTHGELATLGLRDALGVAGRIVR